MGADVRFNTAVTGLSYDPSTGVKTLSLSDGSKLKAKAVIVAGGVQPRELAAQGADASGVHYLDSKGLKKTVGSGSAIVVGSANSAGQAAIDTASTKGAQVTVLTRSGDISGMSAAIAAQIEHAPNIRVLKGEIEQVAKNKQGVVVGARLKDGSAVKADGIGVFIGQVPRTDWAGALDRTDRGKVVVGGADRGPLETTIPGVFAAGDVREGSTPRVAAAAGEGAAAMSYANSYIDKLGSKHG